MAAGTDGETLNPNVEAEPAVRRSLGRRRSEGGKKKKKIPQRGMGMEKLERERIQEEWNKISHQPPPFIHPSVDPINHYLGFPARMPFPNSDLRFGITNHSHFHAGLSKDHSSTPNSLNCNSCHKKKKVNSRNLGSDTFKMERGFVGMNFRENLHNNITLTLSKDENEALQLEYAGNKGSSSQVIMEYEFFPSSQKADIDNDLLGMMNSSSAAAAAAANPCLDLSLKL